MASIATSLTSKVKLNDGIEMPLFGFGVSKPYCADDEVLLALMSGYKLIETAEFYWNNALIRRAIKHTGVKREGLFVVTKLSINGAERCRKIFHESLKILDTGYIDLYLIHYPSKGKNIETYKTMLELKAEGLVRSVGVANFGVQHLEGLKAANLPTPAVNRIELHPWQKNREIVKYCRENGITVMGYSPLTKGQKLNNETLQSIAAKYEKSPADILIRWSVQHGFITILEHLNPTQTKKNTEIFDWSITDEDMAVLDELPDEASTWNPCDSPWLG